jgi:hypothetical protein
MKRFLITVLLILFLVRIYYNRYIFHFLFNINHYTSVVSLFEKYGCLSIISREGFIYDKEYCSRESEIEFKEDYSLVKQEIESILEYGYIDILYPVEYCRVFFRFGSNRGICYVDSEPSFVNYLGILILLVDQIPFSSCVTLKPMCILLPYSEYPLFGKWEKRTYKFGQLIPW